MRAPFMGEVDWRTEQRNDGNRKSRVWSSPSPKNPTEADSQPCASSRHCEPIRHRRSLHRRWISLSVHARQQQPAPAWAAQT